MWPGFGSAWGSVAKKAMSGGFGRTLAGGLWGAAVGGAYGAMSDNTSVLGGAIKGSLLGAVGARYGGAALRRTGFASRGIGVAANAVGTYGSLGKAAAMGIRNQAMMDYRILSRVAKSSAHGVVQSANRGYSSISSTLKGWGSGIGPLA